MPKQKLSPASFSDLMLLSVTVIWGSGFIASRMAVDVLSPSLILAARFLIAAVAMGIIFRRELPVLQKSDLIYGLVAGAILFAAFLTQTTGLKYTTPSNNAFLTSTNVVMVPFISWGLFRQRPALRSVVVALCCFLGAFLLSYTPGIGLSLNLGDLLTLACAFFYALHISFLGLSRERIKSAAALNFLQLAAACVLSGLYYLIFDCGPLPTEGLGRGLLSIAYLGVFPTALCFFLQSYAQRHVPATRAAVILCTEGLFGSVFSVLLGYERPTARLLIGGAVIIGSILFMEVDFVRLANRLGIRRRGENSGDC